MEDINSVSEIPIFSKIIQEFKGVGNIQDNNADHDRREQFDIKNKINPNRNDSNNEKNIFMLNELVKMKIYKHSTDKIT